MKKSQLKLFLKKIVTEARLLENVQDPTKDEMFNYLHQMYGNEESFRDDAEVAIYWFANFYHGGQSSHLYSVLSTSRFHPGPMAKGPEPRSSEEMMYEDLVLKFAPGTEEAVEIQKKHNSLNENISLTPKNQTLIEKWMKEHGDRQAAYKMVNSIVKQRLMIGLEDLPDTATLANGLDDIEGFLTGGDFTSALRTAMETAKEFIEEEGGEGLMEAEQHSIKDLERFAKQEKNPYVRKAMGANPKQKSNKFFGDDMDWPRIKQNIDKGTLKEWGEREQVIYKDRQGGQDVYWMDNKDTGGKIQVRPEAVQKLIRRGHRLVDLQDVNEGSVNDEDADYVEYHSQRAGEKPFTLKTGNGQEKFEYVNAKYPSGKIDIGIYAFRGDVVYGYNTFKKMFNIK